MGQILKFREVGEDETGKHSLKEPELSTRGVFRGMVGLAEVQHTEVESGREMGVSFDLETRP